WPTLTSSSAPAGALRSIARPLAMHSSGRRAQRPRPARPRPSWRRWRRAWSTRCSEKKPSRCCRPWSRRWRRTAEFDGICLALRERAFARDIDKQALGELEKLKTTAVATFASARIDQAVAHSPNYHALAHQLHSDPAATVDGGDL